MQNFTSLRSQEMEAVNGGQSFAASIGGLSALNLLGLSLPTAVFGFSFMGISLGFALTSGGLAVAGNL